jgi:hypothetical protein
LTEKQLPPWWLPLDPSSAGLQVTLVWDRDAGWCVITPDRNFFSDQYYPWRPGQHFQWRNVPLDKFLIEVEEWCQIERPAISEIETG